VNVQPFRYPLTPNTGNRENVSSGDIAFVNGLREPEAESRVIDGAARVEDIVAAADDAVLIPYIANEDLLAVADGLIDLAEIQVGADGVVREVDGKNSTFFLLGYLPMACLELMPSSV
jgi:hypothetical protein